MTTTTEPDMTNHPTLPTYQPMHVRLVGHRSLGVVRARWLGCLLELDDRTVYGPSAVFEVRPAEEPQPKPTGKNRTVWLGWDPAGGAGDYTAWTWYVQPAPVAAKAPPPDPSRLLRGWEQVIGRADMWRLMSSSGAALATVNSAGTTTHVPGAIRVNGRTGLAGKAWATDLLLNDGYKWTTDTARDTYTERHSTGALGAFENGDFAMLMVGGRRREVGCVTREPDRLLFTDGTWLTFDEAASQIAARVPASDDIPF